MRRRAFIAALGGAAAWPLVARRSSHRGAAPGCLAARSAA